MENHGHQFGTAQDNGNHVDRVNYASLPSTAVSGPSATENPNPATTDRDGDATEEPETFSDIIFGYINRILMEEDVDEEISLFDRENAALQATEKPFYEILGQQYPPPSPELPGRPVSVENFSQYDLCSGELGSLEQSALQFRRGMEEAQKFLPSENQLSVALDLDGFALHHESNADGFLGRRKATQIEEEDFDLREGRSVKQSAAYSEGVLRSEMFDEVLLWPGAAEGYNGDDLPVPTQDEEQQPKASVNGGGKAQGKKQQNQEAVDLSRMLIYCAQAVAADDHPMANELLNQIRQYSSPFGDGNERIAHCFADGLQARMAGTGSLIYHTLVAKRTTATGFVKAFQLYLSACPFQRVSHFFANHNIMNALEKGRRLHIVDFGIYFGFQWPCLIHRLSLRPGGPPRLRITGIDSPRPGFRPTERVEETGRRLAEYAKSFNVPFEYNGIAAKWEAVRVEELKIDPDEVLVVNCLFHFKNLIDETVAADSPRNRVLRTIRRANPDVFVHGVVNGSYGAPFFSTRFRQALFHYSALFDMLDATAAREDPQRMLIESDVLGREALNVVSCEGAERVERPETYKQWQVRTIRAGFTQLALLPGITKKAKGKVRCCYHKDFVIDEDGGWMLQGWKGRILYALSAWKST